MENGNKNAEKIRHQENTPNSVKAFAMKMETRANMTRNQWHGKEVDRNCPHCNKTEDEEHTFKTCKWTKEVTKIFKNIEKKWDKDVKPKNRLEGPLIGTRTTAWPMKNRQSQTLAWRRQSEEARRRGVGVNIEVLGKKYQTLCHLRSFLPPWKKK